MSLILNWNNIYDLPVYKNYVWSTLVIWRYKNYFIMYKMRLICVNNFVIYSIISDTFNFYYSPLPHSVLENHTLKIDLKIPPGICCCLKWLKYDFLMFSYWVFLFVNDLGGIVIHEFFFRALLVYFPKTSILYLLKVVHSIIPLWDKSTSLFPNP